MKTQQECLTPGQVLSELTKRYQSNLPKGMKEVFYKLHQVYNEYRLTGDIDTLRYLLALCLRVHHGRRMPWVSTRKAVERLINNNIFSHAFKSFADLYNTLEEFFRGIRFAQGPLTLYDTALNIGQLLTPPVEPGNDVYLNAGARDGAAFLKGRKSIKHIMPVTEWQTPNLFPNLDSKTIEAILCIYKNIFKNLSVGQCVTPNGLDVIENPCIAHRPRHFPDKREFLKKMGYAII